MTLNATVAAIRAYRVATGFTPLYTMALEQARIADKAVEDASAGEREPVDRVLEVDIPGPAGPLPVRVYRPAAAGPLPVLVYFFGGGWILGSLDTSDGICRSLTNSASCLTISIGYRLAPEDPFPAAVEDSYAALRWVAEHAGQWGGDTTRVAVAGDSSGGNLAAAVTMMARDRGGPRLAAQVLAYPPMLHDATTASMRDNVDPMFFNASSAAWYWDKYLADPGDGASPLASPLTAADHSGLPPALVLTAEHCPLRDEGDAYAAALAEAGVPVEHRRYRGLPHGFLAMAAVLDEARDAMGLMADYLVRQWGARGDA